jgi:tetratricopeptide (TPR) repeat protein
MNRMMLVFCVVALASCANPYAQFYKGTPDARLLPAYDSSQSGLQIYRSANLDQDRIALMRRSFIPIGDASFNAAESQVTEHHLREQAQKIGAHAVLVSSKYSHTLSGAVPLTVPNATTTYSTGTATAFGAGGAVTAYGSGTTTSYGSQTVMMPYSIARSDFAAIFFAKFRSRAGLFTEPLDDDTRRRLQTNSGVKVLVVSDGSPAFHADVVPGDVIISLADETVQSPQVFSALLKKYEGQTVTLRIDRDGKTLEKTIALGVIGNNEPQRGAAAANSADQHSKAQSAATERATPVANPEAIQWSEKSLNSANRGEWAEAIRTASVAISLDPNLESAYINRCWAYLARGDLDEAVQDCETALRLEPENMTAINNRGAVLAQQGKTESALGDYSRACLGGFDLGCENFRKIRGYSPKDVGQLAQQALDEANRKFANKDWEGVIASTSRAIELQPTNVAAFVTRAGAYANANRLTESLSDAQTAIRLNPDEGLAYNNRGFVFELQKKVRQAILEYEIACGLKAQLGCDNLKRLRR